MKSNNIIIWSPAAENDFDIILEYLNKNWSSIIVSRFISETEKSIDLLYQNPTLFPLINNKLKIRKCVVTKHNTLYYRTVKNKIEVVRFFDSRQDPKKRSFTK